MSQSVSNVMLNLQRSRETARWVASRLDGLHIERLRATRQNGLAAACWHVAIEHSQAVVTLVEDALYASALAMIRPLLEAHIRGAWLMRVASEDAVVRAFQDSFPDFSSMVRDLERAGVPDWIDVKKSVWERLCSFTHTGSHQIAPRLTAEGLGYNYDPAQIIEALKWADGIALLTVVAVADLAQDAVLATEAHDRLGVVMSQSAVAPQ